MQLPYDHDQDSLVSEFKTYHSYDLNLHGNFKQLLMKNNSVLCGEVLVMTRLTITQ